ncbi:MAG: acyl-CoA/acyl-ACP dehydrogenase [Chloroflexi bacterium]|nr:acyl-CoA/acyl-ACP dehydrogenase [Ardenticatenaceae bacterium]MBL1127906.1 acyl-CoA dehydrogenase [Chloroflexota bacterium]NOG33976.1 acyl-CoA/acyl-ACP dehydrogenase [Chloroflexota bacterium]GIK55661.1 MAG: BEC protein [Chloroflexota bacterium]
MTHQLTAEFLFDDLTPAERERLVRVEAILPMLRAQAETADAAGRFYEPHRETMAQAGLLGLVVPEAYGGLGGNLRDLAAATFAMGTACPSTALAYFFHCSTSSRGLLALDAIAEGRFKEEEIPIVHRFAENVLHRMGTKRQLLGNFASETAKSSQSAVFISTEAESVAGGWRLNGVKSFGCNTGVADAYLVAAKRKEYDTAEGLAMFFVPRDAPGVKERPQWDALGMRATASHGIILEDVFVPDTEALAIPGAFVTLMQTSRGSLMGNQPAIAAIYLGAAKQAYDYALATTLQMKFQDTGRPIATSPFHQELIGKMTLELETARLWLRRQIDLETCQPPIAAKNEVVQHWRLAKGAISECAFTVAQLALKMTGTSGTANSGVVARMLRDIAMSLVMAFPAERGRLEAAKSITDGAESKSFTVASP